VQSQRTLIHGRREGDPEPEPARRRPFRARRDAQPPNPEEPAEQHELLGRYTLLERLGAGGFGVVWRARDELLQREVALKRIWLGPDGDGERAAREAHASARLAHPAIVALYEACPQGEAFYLISELVHGPTLGRLIADDALDDEDVLRIGIALAEALEHAHARGVIHRDIKPQNVLVPEPDSLELSRGPRAAAKLTDFGGASIAEEDALTRTGDVLGTLAYMAPEQSEGREVGEEADLYALALLLYEAFAGVNPVRGATAAATARRIGTRLESLARRRRDLPRALTRAIDAALAPLPRERGTLEQLRLALADALLEESPPPERARGRRAGEQATRAALMPEPIPFGRATIPLQRERERAALEQPSPDEQAGELPVRRHAHTRAREPHGLPRFGWAALGLAGIVWELCTGHAGIGLLLAAALLPLTAIPSEPWSRRISPLWVGALLAPALGAIGLAGAYPALAGQAARWRMRLALGAIGYWWLTLAQPLLGGRLWLAAPAAAPPRSAWEGSLTATAQHVLAPRLTLAVALGAALWGAAAVVLPLLVRGRHAALDVFAATVWSALLASVGASVYAGLAAGAHAAPRGAVLGAVLGGLLAVGARALRGPV
jgi:eukaryotic-like serine/threonine-protein kinase